MLKMKDNKILLLIPLLLILLILVSIMFYDNYNTRKINEKLKENNFRYKAKLKRYKDFELQQLIKNN